MQRNRSIASVILLTLFCTFSNLQAQWTHTNGPWGASLYRLAVDGNTTYATDGTLVFQSADGGHTWTDFSAGSSTAVYAMLISDNTMYFGGQGVAISRDHGATWESGLTAKGVNDLSVLDTNIIAMTSAGVYATGKSAARWHSLSPKSAGYACYCGTSRNSSFFVGTTTGLFRTDDVGSSWSQINQEPTTAILVEGDTIYAGSLKGIQVSMDNGANWTAGSGVAMSDTTRILRIKRIQGKLFAATQVGPQVSFDNGITWSRMPGTMQSESISDMIAPGSGVVFGGSKGAFTSPDLRTWTINNHGLAGVGATAVAADGGTLYGSSWYENLKSTDNGQSWQTFAPMGPQSYVNQIVIHDGVMYLADAGYGVFRSTNNGTNWTLTNSGLSSIKIWSLLPYGNWLIAGIYPDGSYRSPDQGASWELRDGFSGWGVTFTAAGSMVWGAGSGKMAASTDSGATWLTKSAGLPNTYMMSTTSMGSMVFVASYGSGVFSTTNNGDLWESVGTTLPFTSVDLLYAYHNLLFAFSSTGAAVSRDSGRTWDNASQGLPATQTYFSAVASGTDLVIAGDHGFYKRPLAEFATLDAQVTSSDQITVSAVPNPATDRVTLRGNSLRNATMRLYSITGELLSTTKNSDLPIASIDLAKLSAGMYHVVIESNGRTSTHSIVRR
jgi:hypothetical protein